MEARQFDRWTRLFDGASRRDVITLLATGISGGLVANGGARDVLAQAGVENCKHKGDNCNNNNDCCNNLKCKNGECEKNSNNNNNNCKHKGDNCNNNNDCCNKLKCKGGTCKKNNNNNNCKNNGEHCHNNNDCCNNLKCNNNNKCK